LDSWAVSEVEELGTVGDIRRAETYMDGPIHTGYYN
jgi:hypothetical protein